MNFKKQISLQDVKNHIEIKALVEAANSNLEVLGYTEHGHRHVSYVSRTASNILSALGHSDRMAELAAITGWIHDIGNAVNRSSHGLTGAILSYDILARMGMAPTEIAQIIAAIGNHEEQIGTPINIVSAAVTIADKSDAHRSRVGRRTMNDIHGRVNLSIQKNYITVDKDKKVIKLFIYMDTKVSATMEFLEIYLERMLMCEKAAALLGCSFELIINKTIINRQNQSPTADKQAPTEKNVSGLEQ